ncbi:MAG TPA: pilus assembly protein PilM [Tepidisphaeraceae bacterium]|nr:pilus assembly protein PilM [Tepidisphaeraceae bacterium]
MFRLTKAHVLPIGVDIGHDSVKMIQLEVVGGSLAVTAAAKMAMPAEVKAAVPGPAHAQLRLAVAADLVRQMLRQHPFRGRRIVASLPREVVHTKNLRLPQMPLAELPAVCQFEARNVFPFDTDNAVVHHLPAGDVRQGAEVRQEVILMAAKNDDVTDLIEHLNRAGVVVESLDVEPCALYRSVERFIRRREDENDVNVIVDVGVRRSQVVIGKGRDISFVKPIDIGGWHFHDAVSKKLGITPDEAEALRRRLIESGEPAETAGRRDPVRQAVFDATRTPMEELGREISLCLRYYSVTFRGHRPTRLRLVGGEASDPHLQALLNAALVIPVEIGRPMYSVDTSRMKPTDRRGSMCEWALALGLALRTTTSRFGPRDGKPRDPNRPDDDALNPPAPAASTAEVVDLGQAVRDVANLPPATAGAAAPHPTYAERSAPLAPARANRTESTHA